MTKGLHAIETASRDEIVALGAVQMGNDRGDGL